MLGALQSALHLVRRGLPHTWWQEGKARGLAASISSPPKRMSTPFTLVHGAVQMSDREQHLGGGPARPEDLNRAWCCVRASACHSNDFWLPVVTISEIAVSASRTALARISVSLGWTLQGGGAGGSSCPVPSSLVCGAWKRSLLFRKVLWF